MVKFTGYQSGLSNSEEENDFKNILLFLKEVPQIFTEFTSGDGNIFKKTNKEFLEFYSEIENDYNNSITETIIQIENELQIATERFRFGRRGQSRYFSHYRIRIVGLTNASLKLKLNTNKANWDSFNAKRGNKTNLSESDKEDVKSIIDLTKSILQSLFAAWGIGEAAKEFLDVLKSIIDKLISE